MFFALSLSEMSQLHVTFESIKVFFSIFECFYSLIY